jgi:hypothetical protein
MANQHPTAGIRRPAGNVAPILGWLVAAALVLTALIVLGLRSDEEANGPVEVLDPACAAFRDYQASANGAGLGVGQMLTQIEAVWGLGQRSQDPSIVEATDSLWRSALSRDLAEFGPAREAMDSACSSND